MSAIDYQWRMTTSYPIISVAAVVGLGEYGFLENWMLARLLGFRASVGERARSLFPVFPQSTLLERFLDLIILCQLSDFIRMFNFYSFFPFFFSNSLNLNFIPPSHTG
jgi:hypothetical protein